jgi:predicted O-methyltransferase YrrM
VSALDQTSLREWADEQVDMAPHIQTLTKWAAQAATIIEWGVRGGVSTWALLDGLSPDGSLWSVDVVDCVVPPRVSEDPRWVFIVGDDLDPVVIRQLPKTCDLLFIDTSHTYEQTVAELALAVTFKPKRIVMHDFVMEPVARAAYEFMARESWRLVDNELPFGLATLEPM